jgi:hypothetical protein
LTGIGISVTSIICHSIVVILTTRLTWRVSLVEQELFTLPQHLSSPPVFSGVHVTRSLVLCVFMFIFVDRCLLFYPFSFSHCVVCSSLIYGFWLLFLQTPQLSDINSMITRGYCQFDRGMDISFTRISCQIIVVWATNQKIFH